MLSIAYFIIKECDKQGTIPVKYTAVCMVIVSTKEMEMHD